MKMCVQSRLWRVGLACGMLLVAGASLRAQPADTNYDESKVPAYKLPPLLPADVAAESDADRAAIWKQSRRGEVQRLFEQSVYGKTPTAPMQVRAELLESSDQALGGKAVRQQLRLTVSPSPAAEGLDPERSIDIHVLIYAPKPQAADQPKAPAFMGLNFYGNQTVHSDPQIRMPDGWMRANSKIGIVDHRATEQTRGTAQQRWQPEMLIARGYGLVTMYCGDIDPDNYQHDFSDGVHPLFYKSGQTEPAADEWGAIGGWAWGVSTVRAWLEEQPDAPVDAKRIAVIGHSRLGKTALWAGAQDEKFAMVISNDSGCGGAALYRRCYGERIQHMIKPIGYWFCRDHAKYAKRESELPVDQHMLLALVAPRPLYVASAHGDRWADPKGEFLSAKHASPVYEWLGHEGLPADQMPAVDQPVAGRVGYHVRTGKHDVTRFDWQQYLDFADKHL